MAGTEDVSRAFRRRVLVQAGAVSAVVSLAIAAAALYLLSPRRPGPTPAPEARVSDGPAAGPELAAPGPPPAFSETDFDRTARWLALSLEDAIAAKAKSLSPVESEESQAAADRAFYAGRNRAAEAWEAKVKERVAWRFLVVSVGPQGVAVACRVPVKVGGVMVVVSAAIEQPEFYGRNDDVVEAMRRVVLIPKQISAEEAASLKAGDLVEVVGTIRRIYLAGGDEMPSEVVVLLEDVHAAR
jgi:hypothetical protein